jgi:hypothetical protein
MNWLAAGFRHHVAATNNIMRHTFMPKSGNKDKVREYYSNVINHIIHGTKFDVLKLTLYQMICKKRLLRDIIYFAPYIMSLNKSKTGFNGLCDMKHEIYRPFYNAKAFLNRPLTPYGQYAEAQNVAENVEIHVSDDENANVGNIGFRVLGFSKRLHVKKRPSDLTTLKYPKQESKKVDKGPYR